MKDVLVRSGVGLVFLALMISMCFLGAPWIDILFGLLVVIGIREFMAMTRVEIPQIPYLLLSLGIFLILAESFPLAPLTSMVGLVIFLLIIILLSRQAAALGLLGVLMTAVPFGMLLQLPDERTGIPAILYFFALLWTNDTMAYVTGRLFGRRKLAPSVSPKKTWEGFMGGVLFSVILGIWLAPMIGIDQWKGAIAGMLIGVLGTLGDLTESRLKRHYQVKDSGTIMPGHGGVLDRFDGLIYAAPVFVLLLDISTS